MSDETEGDSVQEVQLNDKYLKKLQRQGVYFGAPNNLKAQYSIHAYKKLRTHTLLALELLQAQSVLVTGPTVDVGKTIVSLNLAFNIAKLKKKRVILIDLDFRGSSMQSVLGINKDYGTERIADAEFSFNRATTKIHGYELRILTCAKRLLDSSEILLAPATVARLKFFRSLSKDHIVIFDSPPILGCDDVAALLPSVEAAIMVVSEGSTSRRELSNAAENLGSLPIISTVLNKSRDSNIRKYYY